jgi:hypothetical protein
MELLHATPDIRNLGDVPAAEVRSERAGRIKHITAAQREEMSPSFEGGAMELLHATPDILNLGDVPAAEVRVEQSSMHEHLAAANGSDMCA